MRYVYLRKKLETGDIAEFSGSGPISLFIRLVTLSRFSHIGLIVRRPDGLYLLESDFNKKKNGVQVNHLGRRIKEYKGKVYIRRLDTERTPEMLKNLDLYIAGNRNTSYEAGLPGLFELLGAAIDVWPFHNKANAARLFCSELVTAVFQLWGFISYDIPANEITPKDYNVGGDIDGLLLKSTQYAKLKDLIPVT
ncbi:hypothetical protein LCGC14_2142890 [marine sediment metagenome]|uniref:Uncharacterized protein n=1 Tax=marine sediment metagenome TaxID=412755 RepID=A0A0F9GAW4_9ZZZZ